MKVYKQSQFQLSFSLSRAVLSRGPFWGLHSSGQTQLGGGGNLFPSSSQGPICSRNCRSLTGWSTSRYIGPGPRDSATKQGQPLARSCEVAPRLCVWAQHSSVAILAKIRQSVLYLDESNVNRIAFDTIWMQISMQSFANMLMRMRICLQSFTIQSFKFDTTPRSSSN